MMNAYFRHGARIYLVFADREYGDAWVTLLYMLEAGVIVRPATDAPARFHPWPAIIEVRFQEEPGQARSAAG